MPAVWLPWQNSQRENGPQVPKWKDFPIREQHPPLSLSADPPPYIDGIRINSPHYLTKIKLTSPGTHTFTLVVSQYEKQNTIHYTVRVRKGTGTVSGTGGYSGAETGILARAARNGCRRSLGTFLVCKDTVACLWV